MSTGKAQARREPDETLAGDGDPGRRGWSNDRVGALTCSAFLLGFLLLHSLLAPPFRGPDEPHHLDLAREWSYDADYDVVSRHISSQVTASLSLAHFGRRSTNLEQAEAAARHSRPRFDELGDDVPSTSYNQISQHGPLYSAVLGTAVAGIDLADPGPRWAFDRELGLMRILSILLVVPVPALIFLSARQMGLSTFSASMAGLVPASIPQFTHINALVNNDSMLVLFGAIALWLITRRLRDGPSVGLSLALGATIGLGFMTKGFMIGPFVAILATVAVASWRARSSLRSAGLEMTLIAGSTVLAGGWWLVRNVLVFGSPQPEGPSLLPPPPSTFEPSGWAWFTAFRETLPRTLYGQFGWLELPLDWSLIRVGLLVLVVPVLIGMARSVVGWRHAGNPGGPGPLVCGLLLVPSLVIGVYVAVATYRGHVETGRFPGMQGRYLFAALPFVAVLAGWGVSSVRRWCRASLMAAAMSWILFVQWQTAVTMLRFYWGPPGGSLRDQIAAMLSWSPWPIGVSLLFAAVASIGVAAMAVTGARLAWQETSGGAGTTTQV